MRHHYPGCDDSGPNQTGATNAGPTISDLIEPWDELTSLLDELGTERTREEQLPPHRRYLADKLHRLLCEISDLMLLAEIDYALETLEMMERPSRRLPPLDHARLTRLHGLLFGEAEIHPSQKERRLT